MRIFICLAIIVTAQLFSSCNMTNEQSTTQSNQIIQPSEDEWLGDIPEIVFTDNLEIRPVRILRTGGLSSMDIRYPEIGEKAGDIDLELSELIYNAIITDAQINGREYDFFEFHRNGWVCTNMSYRVTYFNNNLLSVHYFGCLYGGGAGNRGYAAIQGAVTIDLNAKKVLSLGDLFTYNELYDIIENQFISENSYIFMSDRNPDLLKNEWQELSETQWSLEYIHDIKNGLSDSLSSGKLLDNTRSFYITENGIGFIELYEIIQPYTVIIEINKKEY
ncbi:MAG: hypothetical protein FWF94_01705 [Oscillospiraceae bacterium]|nr:hypothetical protein [Oscillospiraceae bacterium]